MPTKPPRLEPGQTIAIVAPSSPLADEGNLQRAVKKLHALGFKTLLGKNVSQRRGFLAGSDRERAGDLMRAFTNPRVHAILCVRGGHGATRLLPLLDYEVIAANPKIFVGYSDVTALHCALRQRANLVTFHGPMLNADFVTNDFPPFVRDSFLRTLTQAAPAGGIRGAVKGVSILRRGVARGELLGGNLTVLCSLLGTPWQPDFRRKIIFLEEVNEAPYRVDRLLTQLLNAGLLQQAAGIAIGQCAGCVDATAGKAREFRQTLDDVLRERLLPLKIPVVTGLPFGHVRDNATLPFGVRATLDARQGDLVIEAAAVTAKLRRR